MATYQGLSRMHLFTNFLNNLVQCESALQVNKKRKADTAFREDFDYIYIEGSEEEKELFRNVKRVIEVVV
ncbi:332_t:CDS:2, partial [Rhizophagus irregularis]